MATELDSRPNASSSRVFSCVKCHDLGLKFLWLRIADLRLSRLECHTCGLLWDAAVTILNSNGDEPFSGISIPQRADDDSGPLRISISPANVPESQTYNITELQIYRKQGKIVVYLGCSGTD